MRPDSVDLLGNTNDEGANTYCQTLLDPLIEPTPPFAV
jgi:hypothetical protein